jgi:hypothetical protein
LNLSILLTQIECLVRLRQHGYFRHPERIPLSVGDQLFHSIRHV